MIEAYQYHTSCVKSLALWEEKEIRFWMYTMQKNEPILKGRALCGSKSYYPP